MDEGKPLSADEARLVIRMVGAAITGQFQEVSGWSGEEAEAFFARFDMLRPYSNKNPGLPTAATTSRAQQVSRAYQNMNPATTQGSSSILEPAMERPQPSIQPSIAASSTIDIHQLIDSVAQKMDLPAKLVHSVVFAESSYRADAVSPAGAEGLMQLMPATASEVGVKDAFDPQDNLIGGCRYLKGLLVKYHGDLDHALAAYNWGQGNVDRKGLKQMPTETRNYIAKVKQGLEGQV
ncbi:MAG: lytic transglycosylase domain-containing protein [Desulfuromonas sp.]